MLAKISWKGIQAVGPARTNVLRQEQIWHMWKAERVSLVGEEIADWEGNTEEGESDSCMTVQVMGENGVSILATGKVESDMIWLAGYCLENADSHIFLNKYFLSIFYVPDTVPDTRDPSEKIMHNDNYPFWTSFIMEGRQTVNNMQVNDLHSMSTDYKC